FLPLITLLACWARAPGPVPLAQAEAPLMTFEERVPSNAVDLVLAVRAGSAHDPVGQEGLAWLTAHAVARAGGPIGAALYDLGAHLQVDVGPELVIFHLRCRVADAVPCAQLLGQALTEPDLSAAALDVVRAQVDARLSERSFSDPGRLARQVFDWWTYEGHPYGHDPLGRAGVISTLSSVDLVRFFEDRYLRSAAALGIAGEPTPEAVVDVQAALTGLPPRLYTRVTPRRLPEVDGRSLLVVTAPVVEAWIVLGHATDLRPDDPDRLAVQAGLEILGAGRDSRLGRIFTSAEGVETWVDAAIDGPDQRVQPELRVELRPPPGQELASLVTALGGLKQMVSEGPSSDELTLWQAGAVGRAQAASSTPLARAQGAVVSYLLGAPTQAQRIAAIQALEPETVAAALARWVHPDDLRVVVLTANRAAFEALGVEASVAPSVPGSDAAQVSDYGVGISAVTYLTAEDLLR
ncbi:MAG: insulinase family protein, partial [Oligoflexia bacterium]|nr:insulinase family protein [Oligoflexia bacterium]